MLTFKDDSGIEIIVDDTIHSNRRGYKRDVSAKAYARLTYLAANEMIRGHFRNTYSKLVVNTKVKGRQWSIVINNIVFDPIKKKLRGTIITIINGFTRNGERVIDVATA
jgi:hypothetical protein